MSRQQKKKKVWKSPDKIQAFLRFNDLPDVYFRERRRRKKRKKSILD